MIINKETIEQGALRFLRTLFSLPEIEKVAIKDVIIHSPEDCENIKKGLTLCYHDNLSDIDFNAWLRLSPVDFHGETPFYKKNFSRLGIENEIFGVTFIECPDDEHRTEGMRICLKSGFRMDFFYFIKCDKNAETLPKPNLQEKSKVKQIQNFHECQNLDKPNSFWFNSILALGKLLRHDYLISDHLSYMLLMEGLMLQMVDRDNYYRSNFHRYGYSEQLAYCNVDLSVCDKYLIKDDDTYNHIVQNLCGAVLSYDDLAEKADTLYLKRSDIFFKIWDCYLN